MRFFCLVYPQGVEVGAYGISAGGSNTAGNTTVFPSCSTSVYSSWAVVKEEAARKGFVACAWSPRAGLLAVGAEVFGGGGGGGAGVTGGACLLYAVENGFSDEKTSGWKASEDWKERGGKRRARVALVRVLHMAEGYVTACVFFRLPKQDTSLGTQAAYADLLACTGTRKNTGTDPKPRFPHPSPLTPHPSPRERGGGGEREREGGGA